MKTSAPRHGSRATLAAPVLLLAVLIVALALGGAAFAGSGLHGGGHGDATPDMVLLPLFAAAPTTAADEFDPLALITAVNTALRVGKPSTLGALRHFREAEHKAGRDGHQIFLIIRALFETDPKPGGVFPTMFIGGPDWTPAKAASLPRFPLALEGDLPLFLVNGYMLAGKAEDPLVHIDWAEKSARFRAAPLRPTADPLGAVDALTARIPELSGPANAGRRGLLREQALRAIRHARPLVKADIDRLFTKDADAAWAALRKETTALKLAWSETDLRYTSAPR